MTHKYAKFATHKTQKKKTNYGCKKHNLSFIETTVGRSDATVIAGHSHYVYALVNLIKCRWIFSI